MIRPLAYVAEKPTSSARPSTAQFPIIPCTLCGSQENLQREQMKAMLREWDKRFPGRVENMFNALGNVVPSHLMDRQLFRSPACARPAKPIRQGDIAFDEEPCASEPSGAPKTFQSCRSMNFV